VGLAAGNTPAIAAAKASDAARAVGMDPSFIFDMAVSYRYFPNMKL
jgi:hypothetical protein